MKYYTVWFDENIDLQYSEATDKASALQGAKTKRSEGLVALAEDEEHARVEG